MSWIIHFDCVFTGFTLLTVPSFWMFLEICIDILMTVYYYLMSMNLLGSDWCYNYIEWFCFSNIWSISNKYMCLSNAGWHWTEIVADDGLYDKMCTSMRRVVVVYMYVCMCESVCVNYISFAPVGQLWPRIQFPSHISLLDSNCS